MVADPATPETGWPALGYERRPWKRTEGVPMSRAQRRRHAGAYEAAIAPEIAELDLRLPSETTALAEEAASEIARFDAEMGHEIAPFAAILLRTESAASSKIENLTASARAIAEAEASEGHGRGNARLIVANTKAMEAAIDLSDSISPDTILEMHRALLGDSGPDIAGRWRSQQVWIGGSDYGPHGATFVPPHHEHVESLIEDLVRFIDRDDIPVLAHAAVSHAQFETIHPFSDGNGRVGRGLLHAQLRNKGLIRHATVPVSAGLLDDTDAYFDALTVYREGNPRPIVERLAAASFSALRNGTALVEDLREIRGGWDERVEVRRDSRAWAIADVLLRHPVVTAPLLAREFGIPHQNLYRSLEPLVDAGVLVEFTDKKRNRMWRAPEVLTALDRFAERAGRRDRGSW